MKRVLYYTLITLILHLCLSECNYSIKSVNDEREGNSKDIAVFNSRVLQDSLSNYFSLHNRVPDDEKYPQIFCVYVYLDRSKDTIIDISNSIAYRTDLKQLFGIYTKGETSFQGKRLIVKYRDIGSFTAINEAILQESDADSVNCFTGREVGSSFFPPPQLRADSKVYKLISRDSLLLIDRKSLVPTYDAPSFDQL